MKGRPSNERLQRVIDREMPGYVIRPKPERHGKPIARPEPDVATVDELKAKYARRQRR